MKVAITPKAQKGFDKLPKEIQNRLRTAIDRLENDPFPRGCAKLTNQPGFRLRIGSFRLLYTVDTKTRTLTVVKIAHRKEVYR